MPMIQTTEEILDLVDENDEVIGNMPRSEIYAKGLSNFRTIGALIKNKKGKIWIPRRQSHKKLYPGALGFSVGGHVTSGETYEQALIRESKEELNLDITKIPYKLIANINPIDDDTSAYAAIYEIQSDKTPDYNKDDFSEGYWLTPQEIIEQLEHGDISTNNIPIVLKKFYS